MTELRDAYDSPWKDILEAYFEDFMLFFFPNIHADIDWSRGYTFLDQELSQIVRDAELGRRHADKLVRLAGVGSESESICHCRNDASEDEGNPKRRSSPQGVEVSADPTAVRAGI
jgi:hypothetical protein